jgi:hypothetical protein
LIDRFPAIAIDGCRWLHVNPASLLSGRSLSMMYFIELSQFLPEDHALVQALRAQMGPRKGNSVQWAEWPADGSNARSCADVILVNAARLDWRQLKSLVDGCGADAIVLTGRQDSVLSLPLLPRVTALDELLRFMPGEASAMPRKIRSPHYRSGTWVDTTPMPPLPAKALS